MVVQTPVGNQESMATRDLAVDDSRDVDAGFAYEIASEFDYQFGLGQLARGALDDDREIGTDRREIERLFAGKVGNAKAAAQIEEAHR